MYITGVYLQYTKTPFRRPRAKKRKYYWDKDGGGGGRDKQNEQGPKTRTRTVQPRNTDVDRERGDTADTGQVPGHI